MLKGLIYLQKDQTGQLTKLTGSTPNSGRKGGGTPYYSVWGGKINVLCETVDQQITHLIREIHVDPELIPIIRDAYTEEIATKLGHLQPSEHEVLETALKAVDEEETRTARLYAAGKITDYVWDMLWVEWQDKRRSIQESLTALGRKKQAHIADLDAALTIVSKVGILYGNLSVRLQREVLREMISKVVVDREGTILRMELLSPFAYLKRLKERTTGGDNITSASGNKNSSHMTAAPKCSDCAASGGPEETRTPDLYSAIVALSQLSYRPL